MNSNHMRSLAALLFTVLLGLVAGCAVGPNYKRPSVAAPAQFRGAQDVPAPAAPGTATSLADTKWFDLFHDDKLTELVRTSLAQNYDLRIASARVLEARAQLGITRSQFFPTVNGTASFSSVRPSSVGSSDFYSEGHQSRCELPSGGLHPELGARYMGPDPPTYRSRPCAVSGVRRSAPRRNHNSDRRRHLELLRSARG